MLREPDLENGHTTKTTKQFEDSSAPTVPIYQRIDRMNSLAWQLRIRDPAQSLALGSESLRLSKFNGEGGGEYERGIAASLTVLAFLDGEAGKLEPSLSRSLEALSYLKNQVESETLINAWYTLGWSYFYWGDYPAALEFGIKSLNMARDIKLKEKEAWCLDLVASAYRDPVQAIPMYKEARNIFEKIGSLEGQARTANNLATTLLDAGDYVNALMVAQRSLQMAKEGALKRDEINIIGTIGEIFAAKGEYGRAQSILHQAELLFEKYGRDISSLYILVDIGQVYLKQNDMERAEQGLLNALKLAEQMDMRSEQARCHQYLSEIFEKRNQFDHALKHYKEFQTLRESLLGEGALKQLAALRVSHQIESAQREAEINRLQKERLQIELEEHKRLHAILGELATRDSLTNLFNRRHFLGLAEQEWKRALRYQHPLCALMLDLDHFKQINDRYGHAVGDRALTAVANIIRSALRSTEIAGRYGGDEFVILLPETLPDNGLLVAHRIAQTVSDQTVQSDGDTIELATSIGVACMTVENRGNIKTLDELLSRADKALYTAKRAGKSQVRPYSD